MHLFKALDIAVIGDSNQFQHPRTASACGKTAEQAKDDDDGSGPDENIWCIGAVLCVKVEIGLQAHLTPYPYS